MKAVAEALFTVEGTRAKTAKVAALAEVLSSVAARDPARLPFVARFLTGTLLPLDEERALGVGSSLVVEAACIVTGIEPAELGERAGRHGDLGTAVEESMAARPNAPGLRLEDAALLALALVEANGRAEKVRALATAFHVCSPREARYLVRSVLGEMRVGAREGLVEDAIAKAFGRTPSRVRAAHGLVADVGELARLAHEDRLEEARIELGRPVGFMLATPIETARGADLRAPHAIEDKIDGIRAQAHVSGDFVRLFARGKGSVTTAFPDLALPLLGAARAGSLSRAILDGEIVVMTPDGRPRPFSAIQPRLKKTTPDPDLVREHPVHYLVYDLLFEDGDSLLALPFCERRRRLVAWAANAPAPLVVHASRALSSPAPPAPAPPAPDAAGFDPKEQRRAIDAVLDTEFEAARARGFEGLVLKRLDAVYAAGVRGFAWLKVKKALATFDVVVVAAERGQGRRARVLSDYTFAVRDGADLKTIGKAYSGLTDPEVATLTERLRSIATAEERGGYLPVRPEIVLEIAFDGLQRSDRHSSGFALRFPRIARIRDDKRPDEVDTLETVRALWDAQVASGHREDTAARNAERRPKAAKRGRKSGRRPDVRQKSKQLKLFEDE